VKLVKCFVRRSTYIRHVLQKRNEEFVAACKYGLILLRQYSEHQMFRHFYETKQT